MAYSSRTIANVFLDLAKTDGKALTNMHLQKLVFFSHGYTLAFLNQPLTYDVVKAWTFGPVYPELYEELRKYGGNTVSEKLSAPEIDKTAEEMQVINAVWRAYKDYSAYELSAVSHNLDAPWTQVWKSDKFCPIPDSITKNYYKGVI